MTMTPDLTAEFKKTVYRICPQFEIDDHNRKIMNSIFRYAIKHPDSPLDPNKGLFLYGEPGTGKSTIMLILAEFIRAINPKEAFKLVNTAFIAAQYAADGIQALEDSTWNRGASGIRPVPRAFDELGREPNPAISYGTSLNTMRYILELRYTAKSITHATTNMHPNMLKEAYGYHIADRAVEMFNFIEFKGPTRRK